MPFPKDIDLNPELLRCRSIKFKRDMYGGGKFYLPYYTHGNLSRASRREFKRASEAEAYGARVIERLRSMKAATPA